MSHPQKLAWDQLLLVLAVAGMALGAMLNFAPLLPLVKGEFGLSNTLAGMLASATILSHTMLQLPGGQITDSLGGRRAILIGMVVIGVSLVGSAFAPDYGMLLLCRFTQGIGTGIAFIAGIAFTHTLVSPQRRSLAQGLFGGAGNVGILLVMLLSERIAREGGWRGTFLIEGIVVFAFTLLLVVRLRPGQARAGAVVVTWPEVLKERPLYLLGLAHGLTYGVFVGLSSWAATFLWQAHGFGLEWAGPLSAFLVGSAVVGRSVGGLLSAGRERQVMMLSAVGTALFTALVPLLSSALLVLPAMLVLGWFASMPFGAIFSYYGLIAPHKASGRSLSIVNFVANVGALMFPPLIGYILDSTGSYSLGFGAIAAIGLVGSAVMALWLPRPASARVGKAT